MLIRLYTAFFALLMLIAPAQSGTVTVFASGIMPASDVTDGTEVWVWSGSFSDQISDSSVSVTDGIFEFMPSDLATQSFTVDGTSIAFLTPTVDLLDSRLNIGETYLGVSLFLDPGDPYFSATYSHVGFTFSMTGQSFATNPNILETLAPLTEAAVSTVLFLRPEGGSFSSATGTGAVSFAPEVAVISLPASGALLLVGIACLAMARRKKVRETSKCARSLGRVVQ